MLLEPLPGGARWAAALGSLLLLSIVVQVVTGILLAMNYAPAVATAYPSVKFIQEEVPLGWLIRALHHWGASAMVILLLLHLIQVFVYSAYKRPRELTWMVGVLLLAVTLGLAFTGYLLPWDERAYWASKVGLGILTTVPLVGDKLRVLLQGGPQIGNLTLTHFFALHTYVLPGTLLLLVGVHLYLFRLHGVTPPWWRSAEQLRAREEPFWPGQVWKDGVLALLLLVGLGLWCWHRPAPLGALADPSQPYAARPEWYFMFLFEILKVFRGPYELLGTFILPALFFMVLFFWPLLDRSPRRQARRRPVALGLLAGGALGLVGLTIVALGTDVRMQEPALALAKHPPPPHPAAPLQRLDVANVYAANCQACHNIDGTGNLLRIALPTIPNFTDLAWQSTQTEQQFLQRIEDGKPPQMPAFKDKLTAEQIRGLAIYVRAFAVAAREEPPADTVPAADPAGTAPADPR